MNSPVEKQHYIQFRISDQNRAGLERLRQKFPNYNLTVVGELALRAGIAQLEGLNVMSAGVKAQNVTSPDAPPETASPASPAPAAGRVRKVFMDVGRRTPAAGPGLPTGP